MRRSILNVASQTPVPAFMTGLTTSLAVELHSGPEEEVEVVAVLDEAGEWADGLEAQPKPY